MNITLPILLTSDDYSVSTAHLPMTCFIGSNGILRKKYCGLSTEEMLRQYLDDLVAFK